ncbi:MAG: hypothetical protein HYR84_13510 [Planctomycetes bacterium]|nr:hypothetical protein [Planctomycetota bacterium]
MNQNLFEDTLRSYLRREPFQPFRVELVDGTAIVVDEPRLAFAGGGASMLTQDDRIVEFTCEQVREIRPASSQAVS